MQKVLLISDHGDPLAPLGGAQAGGQNNYVFHLAVVLVHRGYAVDVVTRWNDLAALHFEQFGSNCRVIRIAAGHKGLLSKETMYASLPQFYEELCATIDVVSYDVVHTHYWLSGVLGTWLPRDEGLPFMHTSHALAVAKQEGTGHLDPVRLEAEKHVLRRAAAVIATSTYAKNLRLEGGLFTRRYPGTPRHARKLVLRYKSLDTLYALARRNTEYWTSSSARSQAL